MTASALTRVVAVAVVVALLAAVVGAAVDGAFGYHIYTDRDLTRAAQWRTELPIAGAELSRGTGARVPGIGLAVLMGWPFVVTGETNAAWVGLMVQVVAAIALTAVVLGRSFGVLFGAVAAVVLFTDPVLVQTLVDLWNPSFLVLPLGVAVAGLGHGLRHDAPAGIVTAAAAVGMGAQCHLGILGWGAGCAAALCVMAPTLARRSAVQSAVALGVVYLPYLVVDGWRGAENTRRMFASVGQNLHASPDRWARLGVAATTLTSAGSLGRYDATWHGVVSVAVVLPWIAVLLVALCWTRLDRAERALVAVAAAGALVVGWGAVNVSVPGLPTRYLIAVSPLTAVAAAVTVKGLSRAGGRVGGIAALAMTVLLGVRVLEWQNVGQVGDPRAYGNLRSALDGTRAATGLDLAEIVGRTTWTAARDGRLTGESAYVPVDHLLVADGVSFPGSLPPPCLLLVSGAGGGTIDLSSDPTLAAFGATALGPGEEVGGGWTLLRLGVRGAHCPTTMSQRYVDTAVERRLAVLDAALAPGGRAEADGLYAARFDPAWVGGPSAHRFTVGLELLNGPGGVEAVLHSPMLRGPSDNEGWRGVAGVEEARLRFVGPTEVVVPLASAPLGGRHVLTPVRASSIVLPSGRWEVRLEGRLSRPTSRLPVDDPGRFSWVIVEGWDRP